MLLNALDRVFQTVDDRSVPIDDEIEDRVRDVVRPFRQPVCTAFEPAPQFDMRPLRPESRADQITAGEK